MPSSLFSQTAPLGAATTRVFIAAVYILAGLLVVLCAHLLARSLLKLGWLWRHRTGAPPQSADRPSKG